ncbi:hypothetical protein [Macrococcus animalis]|uniref:hypothetical protein n=1 Tax=Macrococcus animalis TaxID=3395467 RepID=UPI0039BEA12D
MEHSILWKPRFIPIYFIVALLTFILFFVIIKTDNWIVILIPLFNILIGITSIIYNKNKQID